MHMGDAPSALDAGAKRIVDPMDMWVQITRARLGIFQIFIEMW